MQCAFLDHQLDFWIMAVFGMAQRQNIASKIPYQVGNKIGLLQKCFERTPELSPYKTRALELLGKAEALNDLRSIIAHGALSHYDEAPEKRLVFMKIKHDKQRQLHLMTDHVLTFRQIFDAANGAVDLLSQMVDVTEELHPAPTGRPALAEGG